MFKQIITEFKRAFTLMRYSNSFGIDLESYIMAQNPKNIADVDYWSNKYIQAQSKGMYFVP